MFDDKILTPFAAFTLFFILLFILEKIFPLRKREENLWRHILINAVVSLTALAAAYFLVMPAAEKALSFISTSGFGIVKLIPLPYWGKIILSILLMDLAFYYWHLANHKIPLLWRFHNVHHIDPDLDITTGFRFHFGEIAFSTFFRIIQITIIGVSPTAYFIYEILFISSTLFHHSSIKIPLKLERVINRIIVTPRMHGIHHSQFKKETNSNYSTVFVWWDMLHRTLKLNVAQKEIKIGVPAYSKDSNNIKRIFTLPFKKQKDYWEGNIERKDYSSDKWKMYE